MERALESIILNYDNLPKKLDIVKDEHEPEMTEYGWR